jgi:hypothetical protein
MYAGKGKILILLGSERIGEVMGNFGFWGYILGVGHFRRIVSGYHIARNGAGYIFGVMFGRLLIPGGLR